ncbi:hypothetical protein IEE_02814 [Bacillus cereus BAG5X1-1]|uniref:MalT-like TPR region domain-containing protein n=1 Tax=Bacillus cereus BAG5X1-1 TaxID=1053189 RepID=J8B0P3_BACCE|nr:hypothetical protein IEE_02814 [Bacillus cereus BAG5X1-1]
MFFLAIHTCPSTQNALGLLNQALKLTLTNVNFLSEKEIDIMHTMAVIYAENGEYEKSIGILKKCLINFNRIEFPGNKEIKLRIIYTLTKCLHLTYEHVEAIKYSDIGIKLAININSLYLLGELNFEKGSNLLELQQSSEDGFNYINKALFIIVLMFLLQYYAV